MFYGGIAVFLDQALAFSFTTIDLPPKFTDLFFAQVEASVLARCLREKLPGDYPARMKIVKNKKLRAEYQEKKLDCIQEALAETFDAGFNPPPYLMKRWVWFSVERIALEVSAWKNNVEPSSVKRHGPAKWREVAKRYPGDHTLFDVMKGDRPAFQTFRDNLLRLQKRILPSYRSLYTHSDEIFPS